MPLLAPTGLHWPSRIATLAGPESLKPTGHRWSRDVERDRRSIMSFLGSLIKAGPVRPSVLTGIFSYQSITLFLCFCFLLLFFISNYRPCPLELTGGSLTNYQCFDLWTTKINKTKKKKFNSLFCYCIAISSFLWQQ